MATVAYVSENDAVGVVREVYEDIRKTFGMPAVPNLFKVMAHNPAYLQASWQRVKAIMGPGLLDRKTKEMIAVAVSATNGCDYCVQAHTGALRAMGSTDGELVELMAVVDLFSGFNKMLEGLQVDNDFAR
ncbi:carboxymuconolactone decarboxylase family protein [Aromatoleum toluvorans]|uniref:Carboxymuconolactone decarboxylase family protein n=1 Tax=Aromatoleum toluvorans TaxID=92002 RepID=A0ABX1PYN7_9RHOO|nr:carboxymuconolactone decarboxylase family protein [Aromatoleum toluvorans]NMG44568.1 carboxymuconolactone decarboxylase family protein [Aromatoleum toluvorans]